MDILQKIILGITQGVSEFLPISSSGHVAVVSYLLGIQPSMTVDIFLNTATFLSVLFYFRNDVKDFFHKLPYIIIGSIPAGLVGVLFKDKLETIFTDIRFLPIFFLITAFMLFLTRYLKKQSEPLDLKKAIMIGFFQAFAILPGVSRSASTIFAGLVLGLNPTDAFKFSFYLFIPASFGALALDIKDTGLSQYTNLDNTIPFIVTFIVGVIALNQLRKLLSSHKLWYFAPYVFAVSLFVYLFAH